MRKRQNKKQLLTLVISLILLSTFLGTSYAYWTKSIVVETKINSGNIEAVGTVQKEYTMCANINCSKEKEHHQSPTIEIQDTGSVPIKITDVRIKSFEYTGEIWDYYKFSLAPWRMIDTRTVTLKTEVENIACNFDYNYKDSKNILTVKIVDNQIREAMPTLWNDNNRPTDRKPWADIYVGDKGWLTLEITYTQFNTTNSTGWKKTLDVVVPVNWVRKDWRDNKEYPSNGNSDITPGFEWWFM